jgi:hypothetical protein
MKKETVDLRLTVRNNVGNPSITRLPESAIDDVLESARFAYSRYRGPIKIGEITTAANQDEYPYDQTKVARLLGVLPQMAGSIVESFEMDVQKTLVNREIQPVGVSSYNNPSLGYIQAYKNASDRSTFEGSWEDRNGKIALMPAPKESGKKVYYEYREIMTRVQIPDVDEDLYMLWATAQALKKIARGQMFAPSVSGGGQSYSFGGSADLVGEATRLEKEFQQRASLRRV